MKQLFSFLAFSAGSVLSYKGNKNLRLGKSDRIKMGLSEARAMGSRVKKIGCEEHTWVRGDLDSGRSGLEGAVLAFFIMAHAAHLFLTALPQPLFPAIRNEFWLSYTKASLVSMVFALAGATGQILSQS